MLEVAVVRTSAFCRVGYSPARMAVQPPLPRDIVLEKVRARILAAARARLTPADAEDLTQEALVLLATKYAEVEAPEELLALGLAILRKKRVAFWRKAARRRALGDSRLPARDDAEGTAIEDTPDAGPDPEAVTRAPGASPALRRGRLPPRRPLPRDPPAEGARRQLRGDRGRAGPAGQHGLQLGLALPRAPPEAPGRPLGLRGRGGGPMMTSDPRRLLGGWATDTLTEAERRELLRAALDDQALFDDLLQEEGLRGLLEDPAARHEILTALERPGRVGALPCLALPPRHRGRSRSRSRPCSSWRVVAQQVSSALAPRARGLHGRERPAARGLSQADDRAARRAPRHARRASPRSRSRASRPARCRE